MYLTGLIIAICTFLIIGLCHPLVIKTEYYYGTRPWMIFLIMGIACVIGSLCIQQTIASSLIGVLGASLLWSIGELFSQKKRVEKGWFPMNPKRKDEYEMTEKDETLSRARNDKTTYNTRS